MDQYSCQQPNTIHTVVYSIPIIVGDKRSPTAPSTDSTGGSDVPATVPENTGTDHANKEPAGKYVQLRTLPQNKPQYRVQELHLRT